MKITVISSILSLVLFSTSINAQDLSALYQKVNPAVVVVITEEKVVNRINNMTKTSTSKGLGSGFMISENQIITAAHVVQVAENISVQFIDGEVIPAKVKTAYKSSDLALLELVWPRKNAVSVKLSNSDEVKVGQQIFIVGAPYGLDRSLSSGYVSGIIKEDKNENPFTVSEFIQTDAAINHGNSGGPMFNLEGDVVGIVSQILTESGGFQGIGFAATSNLARELLLEQSIPWSGMDAKPIVGKLANILNLPQPAGLLVERVVFLSPFGMIGLKGGDVEAILNDEKFILGGDIILAINGIRIDFDNESLQKLLESIKSTGTENLELSILRGGQQMTLKK